MAGIYLWQFTDEGKLKNKFLKSNWKYGDTTWEISEHKTGNSVNLDENQCCELYSSVYLLLFT